MIERSCAPASPLFTLRCTGKLLKRLRASPGVDLEPPTTRLGDWYATLVYERREQLVLCLSERSLLPVVLPAKEGSTLVPRFRDALAELLAQLGVSPADIERERAEMADARIGRTASRQVLGSMNDFLRMLSYRPPGRSLLDESLQLAEAPCGPIGMRSSDDLTVELLNGRHQSATFASGGRRLPKPDEPDGRSKSRASRTRPERRGPGRPHVDSRVRPGRRTLSLRCINS